ncbi:MAG: iron-containing alcohol dehydrogenase [Elusimicrobiales bacterium]
MSFIFHNPVRIEFGCEAGPALERLAGNRAAAIITCRSLADSAAVKKLAAGNRRVFAVSGGADVFELEKLYGAVHSQPVEVIIAIGGGSAIDAAKILSAPPEGGAAAAFARQRALWLEGKPFSARRLPVLAAPATAGSGSDVTPWAVVWDKAAGRKYSLESQSLWPQASVCDPELALSMPRDAALHSGLDALAHALEALWSKNANPVSDTLAFAAAKGALESLPAALREPPGIEPRTQMMLAALRAGLAFSNTRTGMAHALSYYLTLKRGVPHGLACGVMLPLVAGAAEDKDKIAEFGAEKLSQFTARLGVPSLRDLGVSRSDLADMRRCGAESGRGQNSAINETRLWELVDEQL